MEQNENGNFLSLLATMKFRVKMTGLDFSLKLRSGNFKLFSR